MTKDPKPSVVRLPATAPIEELLAAYERDGAVIISGVLTPDQVSRFNDEIEDEVAKAEPGGKFASEIMNVFYGSKTKRVSNMTNVSATFRTDILDHDLLHELTQRTMGKGLDFINYWLSTGQVIEIGPGGAAQVLHRDSFCPLIPPNRDSPEVVQNYMIALCECKEEYGATRVIPGSHRWENFEEVGTMEQTVAAETMPGDALWLHGNVVHCGGANTSTTFRRRALGLAFCHNALTPEEAIPRLVSLDMGRTLSKRAQLMTGFRSQPTPYGPGNWLASARELASVLELEDPYDRV
ncbi:hypothetical protein FE257_008117 [Aspergillus nanangensis]|uniref:Phytanoyl-CoA dioxygenase family protein n=1 Tax=Aspergillus nanangensis TaxID=2582783 RepID=A0AAD4CNG1_ASPNN|nr:hypothetical protein FE257_008117 [Aspergillus nanangensis]